MKSAMIPCKFNLEQMEHPNLLKCRLKVAKTGKNWNGSKFSIESFKKAENTLKNIPILAYIKQTDEDKYDFDGHNIEMRTTETPNKIVTKFHYLERPIGIIPESNNIGYEEEDGETFICCDGYIWKSYANDGLDILMNSDTKSVSMEIEVIDGVLDEEDDYFFDITDFIFQGVTVLGDDVPPAIDGASITKYSNFSAYKEMFSEMLFEINKLNKEGEDMDELNNKVVVEEVEEVIEEVIEEVDEVIEDEVKDEPAKEVVEETEEDEVEDDIKTPEELLEEVEDVEVVEKVEDVVEEEVKDDFSIFNDILETVPSSIEELHDALKDMIGSFGREVSDLKEKLDSQSAELSRLQEFEKEIKSEELKSDMEAIIEKYSMESESLVDLKEKVLANELTVEAFEKEVAFLYATSHLAIKSYSRESKNNEVIIQKNNKNKSMSEYGDVEKYLK